DSTLPWALARLVLSGAFVLASLAALAAVRPLRRGALVVFSVFLIVLVWFFLIPPSNDRDWQKDVAVPARAPIDGDRLTVENVRNFEYRTETDYTPRYETQTYDLKALRSVDLYLIYWGSPLIAHTILSFVFDGDRYLAVSIETRKNGDEAYSAVRGFFRQYELFYVVADERDVVRVRTNYRKDPPEHVYLFRAQGATENARRLFMDYVRENNSLKAHAEWYNTLTTNCTTNIFMHTRVNPGHMPLSWKLVLSGYTPAYAYEGGKLDTSLPFEELKKRSRINDVAHAADQAPDFS